MSKASYAYHDKVFDVLGEAFRDEPLRRLLEKVEP
jgi:hypothetical protein